jgi:XTP/dITP diphosphohydrolase
MKNEFVFATNNKHKLNEISGLVGSKLKILSLSEIGCFDNIPEDQETLEGNALQKAQYIFQKFNKNCFADDTGLEVAALNGRPGVHSARYSEHDSPGVPFEKRSEANISKLLNEMTGIKDRNAVFRTIICLIKEGKEIFFEGKIKGIIIDKKQGINGFGYDPIFIPEGYNISYAEMSFEEKNKISHRAQAISKLIKYLKNPD